MENNIETTKKSIKDLKKEIAELVEYQKAIKEHRKTVNFKGERLTEKNFFGTNCPIFSARACEIHAENRFKLRLMYLVYGILRGKTVSQIEDKYTEVTHPLYGCYHYREMMKEYGDAE